MKWCVLFTLVFLVGCDLGEQELCPEPALMAVVVENLTRWEAVTENYDTTVVPLAECSSRGTQVLFKDTRKAYDRSGKETRRHFLRKNKAVYKIEIDNTYEKSVLSKKMQRQLSQLVAHELGHWFSIAGSSHNDSDAPGILLFEHWDQENRITFNDIKTACAFDGRWGCHATRSETNAFEPTATVELDQF